MNSVKLSGRLTADPELKMTPQNVAVTTFVLAVDRRTKEDKADFPTIVAWRQTAEFASRYLSKGRRIIVEGELRTRTYEDKQTGKKHKVTEVEATNIEFADSKPADAPGGNSTPAAYGGPSDGFEEMSGDDAQLPF